MQVRLWVVNQLVAGKLASLSGYPQVHILKEGGLSNDYGSKAGLLLEPVKRTKQTEVLKFLVFRFTLGPNNMTV